MKWLRLLLLLMLFINITAFSQEEKSPAHKAAVARYERKILEKEPKWQLATKTAKDGLSLNGWKSGKLAMKVDVYNYKTSEEASNSIKNMFSVPYSKSAQNMGEETYEQSTRVGKAVIFRKGTIVVVVFPIASDGTDLSDTVMRFAQYISDAIDNK